MDFPYREPDAIGFQNWRQSLNNCPNGGLGLNNPQCDRVHAALSFYQAKEFGERGYFVFLLYNAVLGRRPTYSEFMAELEKIGGAQSPAESEANKQALTAAFINTQEFHTLYDSVPTGGTVCECSDTDSRSNAKL